ncbi:hypothetical protein BV22DRAFT_1039237 [Leucogyrophana mollusca]|uniref:Uncharacterized protein n=1 Tax=Leucogyrophana mollusca TaxID=85980 RepID=A0ACB8B695_9AGAM|nr:hypothetical protein BV22DRAFT_1039237 [Leucogyrophana mollusca]
MAHSLAPTSSLPPLVRLPTHSTVQIRDALRKLSVLYFPLPAARPSLSRIDSAGAVPVLKERISGAVHVHKPKRTGRLVHDDGVTDSGYASAEEDEVDEDAEDGLGGDEAIDILRRDELERAFAIKWLTGFIKRSHTWVAGSDEVTDEEDARTCIIDDATKLLARFAGDDEPEEALTRQFSFPFGTDGDEVLSEGNINKPKNAPITAELNDAPLAPTDHTAVGLQSWASAILLAERMCADPKPFLGSVHNAQVIRVLELGAGTGLLSIVTAQIFTRLKIEASVTATDYHPSVLFNLSQNVATNNVPVNVHALDWSNPPHLESFDVVLAADVIYHPEHARWIKDCIEGMLKVDGVFWLIIPLRSTGRHEGMGGTVDEVFPSAASVQRVKQCAASDESGGKIMTGRRLAVVRKEEVGRLEGVGRADEGGYKLFEIRWVVE